MGSIRNSLRGTGKVYSFTLGQFLKGKGNLIVLAVMVLVSFLSVPVMTLIGGTGGAEAGGFEELYVQNETALPLDFSALAPVVVQVTEQPEDGALLRVYEDAEGCHLELHCGDEESDQARLLLSRAQGILDSARYAVLNISEEQLMTLYAPVSVTTDTVSGYLDATELDFADAFAVQYVYAILVMILSLFSTSYIVRAVIEEKSSKLVELLMVSIEPMGLIVGKILAAMTYIFSMLLLMVLGAVASYFITGSFMEVASPMVMLQGMGLDLSAMHVGPLTVLISLVSLILGYLTFSVLGGLAGTGCSSMEDVESANLSVILVVMAGYFVACCTGGVGSRIVGTVTSLLPIVSVFCAPIQYVCGNISLPVLCVSWLIQTAILMLLIWLCARVYRQLLLHRGSKVKLRELLRMARQKKGGAAV